MSEMLIIFKHHSNQHIGHYQRIHKHEEDDHCFWEVILCHCVHINITKESTYKRIERSGLILVNRNATHGNTEYKGEDREHYYLEN